MIVCETRTFTIGKYTIQQRPRFDNPSWAAYTIFVGDKVIGKSFSIPDLDCCRWLEVNKGVYAREDETYKPAPAPFRGAILARTRGSDAFKKNGTKMCHAGVDLRPDEDLDEAFAST